MKKAILTFFLAAFFINLQGQEAKFQAMSVYDFTRMLQWPEEYRQGDFYIKVIGNSDIFDEIEAFTKDKRVRGEQKIVVERVSGTNPGKCHILIVTESESTKLNEILTNIDQKGTLVVTQKTGLTHKGAGISFIQDGKGRYRYNLANISDKQITVSTSFKQIGEEN
jgi:hypothetical protein